MKTTKQILTKINKKIKHYNANMGKCVALKIYDTVHNWQIRIEELKSIREFITKLETCKCERPIYMIGSKPKICQRCGGKVIKNKI